MFRMTNDQFNQCKLPKRLDFKTVEAARLVLVHNITIKDALVLTGMKQAGDMEKLTEAIKMFEECL